MASRHGLPVRNGLPGWQNVELCLQNVDFKHNIIHVWRTLSYMRTGERHTRFTITVPKTRAGRRQIPMFASVREALLLEREKQERKGFCEAVVDGYSGFIWRTKNGRPHTLAHINSAISSIVRDYNAKESAQAAREGRAAALLPRFSVHQLRHTFCTRLCEAGTDIKIVQEIMGHATMERKQEQFLRLQETADGLF